MCASHLHFVPALCPRTLSPRLVSLRFVSALCPYALSLYASSPHFVPTLCRRRRRGRLVVSQASGATAPAGRRQWQWAVAVGSGWDDYCDHTVARNSEGKSAALPFRRPVAEHLPHFVSTLCLFTLRLHTLSLRFVESEREGGWVVYRHRASESSRYSHGMRVAVASEYRLQGVLINSPR